MKNLIILISFLVASYAGSDYAYGQFKNIYWVHGMGDEYSKRFLEFETHFKSNYYIYSNRPSYETSFGIDSAAKVLSSKITTRSDQRNIIVTHSMGGPNSIYIYKYLGNRTKIGGILAFNGPFNGAYIANNVDNGTLGNILKEATDKGLKGVKGDPIVAGTFLSNPAIDIASKMGIYSSVLEIVLSKIPGYIMDEVVPDNLTDENKTSLKVGSADIKKVQAAGGTDLPSIAFFGNEDYPASIKLVKTMSGIVVSLLIDDVDNGCDRFYKAHSNMKKACLLGLLFAEAAVHAKLASNWKTSRDYWRTTFPKSTNVLTGAYRTEKQPITYEEWTCVYPDPRELLEKSTMIVQPVCEYQWVTVTKLIDVIVDEPGDGLLPKSTQIALPGCLKTVELLHMNHDEVTSDESARDQLDNVFKGTTVTTRDPNFFILTER